MQAGFYKLKVCRNNIDFSHATCLALLCSRRRRKAVCVVFSVKNDMPRVATHSDSEESSKSKSNAPKDENGAQDEGEEEEAEYEIEEVLDAKRGVFPDVRVPSKLKSASISK